MKQRLSMKEEADYALETLLTEYQIDGIYEEAVKIFYGDYILLNAKWGIEFLAITFLFIFTGVFLWTWTPASFELKTALKIVLEYGLLVTYRYILSVAPDKKAVETTKKFIALANRYPHYFVKKQEEETKNGTEGNADTK